MALLTDFTAMAAAIAKTTGTLEKIAAAADKIAAQAQRIADVLAGDSPTPASNIDVVPGTPTVRPVPPTPMAAAPMWPWIMPPDTHASPTGPTGPTGEPGPTGMAPHAEPHHPEPHHESPHHQEEESDMAKQPHRVQLVKKDALSALSHGRTGGRGRAAAGAPQDFIFVDNEDSTVQVQGLDAGGNPVDISAVATLTPAPTSSDPASVSVDAPQGLTFAMHGLKPTQPGTPVHITVTATWNDPAAGIGPLSFDLPVEVNAGPAGSLIVVPGTPTVRPTPGPGPGPTPPVPPTPGPGPAPTPPAP